jgi:hypothetical protein
MIEFEFVILCRLAVRLEAVTERESPHDTAKVSRANDEYAVVLRGTLLDRARLG